MTCEMNSFFKIYNKMLVNLVKSIPPITRIQLLVFAIVGGLVYNGILSRYDLYFNLEKIVFSGQVTH
jgi:cell division septal protein FtsQ